MFKNSIHGKFSRKFSFKAFFGETFVAPSKNYFAETIKVADPIVTQILKFSGLVHPLILVAQVSPPRCPPVREYSGRKY